MAGIDWLTRLEQRASEAWLFGIDAPKLLKLTHERVQKLQALHAAISYPTVLLAESDPVQFLAGLIAAGATHCPVFLGNPSWAETEWQQVFSVVHPDLVFGEYRFPSAPRSSAASPTAPQPGWIMIPTGGSSGQVRFAAHTLETLTAAVAGLQTFFQTERLNSCCVLPLYHVSGLMQFLRSFLSGGKLAVLPFKAIESYADTAFLSAKIQFDPADFFLSLVPTQLQRLLANPAAVKWLKRFKVIFLGGAPAWTELLETARQQQLPIALTYGMTETAAQVVALKPELFLRGSNGSGQVLPHAAIRICENGRTLAPQQVGTVTIRAKSLSLGYFSGTQLEQFLADDFFADEFLTDDLGYFDAEGILHIVGRNSQKIITGGENVFPAEVEAALRATGLVNDVCVVGMPDQTWGEVVTAVYVPMSSTVSSSTLKSALTPRLSSFKHPKQWIAVEQLPRNAQGKINIASLKQFL